MVNSAVILLIQYHFLLTFMNGIDLVYTKIKLKPRNCVKVLRNQTMGRQRYPEVSEIETGRVLDNMRRWSEK